MAVPTVELKGRAKVGVGAHLMSAAQLAALPQAVRLGRKRPRARPMALALSHYLDLSAVQLPPSVDYSPKAMQSLSRMYLNDRYGCCVIAGKYHTVGVLSGNDAGKAVVGTDDEVYEQYQSICGPGDNGCVITEVLDVLHARGLPFGGKAHKIDGYVSCKWTDANLVRAALYLFGNLTLGVNLPDAWTSADVWDQTLSQIVGGHDVTALGYDDVGVLIASWGRLYKITWRAFTSTKWLEECYVLLGPDWYGDDKLSPAGVNVEALREDLLKIGGGNVPPIDPGPVDPPAPPAPPPAPGPVKKRLFGLTFPKRIPKGGRVAGFVAPVDIPKGECDVYLHADADREDTYPVDTQE